MNDVTLLDHLRQRALQKITQTLTEMYMALVEVHLGRCIESIRAVWPQFVEARSLVGKATTTGAERNE